ncbi:hypothetical protein BSQ39_00965 [Loigolactobacillus backii]|uniref:TetR/AcrR family transcriptional regulator n=1 Tax=Loigolactobacillus backii TaxID=375175 RepID=UPI000C1C8999|nr:TetR/AcrR family transcriptional regulator [Loigolactobacillus backii]PIO82229.1 hypothetical protein BSQ39_00965 [Loigolactobacillus backii]
MGLRERKKAEKRQEIAENGLKLFKENGFANVTVAQIAATASIAPKTLFTYFKTKDDIVFYNEDELLSLIRHLIQQQTSIGNIWPAYQTTLIHLASQGDLWRDMNQLIKLVVTNETLQGRLLKMWSAYEQTIADTILAKHLTDHVTAYIFANQLVMPLRFLFTQDISTAQEWQTSTIQLLNNINHTQSLLVNEFN